MEIGTNFSWEIRLYQQPLRDDDFFCERAACTAIIIFLGKCIVKQIYVVLLL